MNILWNKGEFENFQEGDYNYVKDRYKSYKKQNKVSLRLYNKQKITKREENLRLKSEEFNQKLMKQKPEISSVSRRMSMRKITDLEKMNL